MKNYQRSYGSMLRNKSSLLQFAIVICVLFVQSCAVEDDNAYTDPREKFIGLWNVNDQPGRINYNVNIVKDPAQSTNLLLYNFADMGSSANGLVVGSRIIIDKQEIGSDFFSNGTGTYITSNKLEFEFVLDDGIEQEPRVAVYSK